MRVCARYLPREVLNGDLSCLDRADMFSLGATLLELAMRSELPSGGPLYQDLRAGKLPLLPTMTTRFNAMVRCAPGGRKGGRAGCWAWQACVVG